MIALRPVTDGKGGNIPNSVIDTALNRHPDGFGIMWRGKDGLGFTSYAPKQRKQFRKALKALDRGGVEYAAHFRWATSGPKDRDMAHPYTYEDPDPEVGTVAVMHNGVIGIAHDRARESDTSAFVRLVLADLPTRWWTNDALVYLVREAIGYSKLTIMTATETVIINERDGTWDNGIWYSSDHLPSKTAKWTNYKGASGSEYGTQTPRTTTGAIVPVQSLVPYAGNADLTGKSAYESAVVLGLVEPEDTITDACTVRTVDRPAQFRHAGHNLTAIVDIDMYNGDRDYEDAVICDECRTIGTVYVIDGTYYIDMAHRFDPKDATDDYDLPESSFEQARVVREERES